MLLLWGHPVERFTSPIIEQVLDVLHIVGAELTDGVSLREVVAQQAILILNEPLLRGRMGIADKEL